MCDLLAHLGDTTRPEADAAARRPQLEGGRPRQPRDREAAPGGRRGGARAVTGAARPRRRRAGCRLGAGLRPRRARAAAGPLAEARALVAEGRFDDVLARVGRAPTRSPLYLLGRAWAGKAQSAPVPTPAPGPAPSGRAPQAGGGARAGGSYERAVAARPDLADAQLAIARCSPRTRSRCRGARGAAAPRRGPRPSRRARAPQLRRRDPGRPRRHGAAEAMIALRDARRAAGEADAAFQELVRRRREDPAPARALRGLPGRRRPAKPEAALAPVRAGAHLEAGRHRHPAEDGGHPPGRGRPHLRDLQYVAAEARLRDARRVHGRPGLAPGRAPRRARRPRPRTSAAASSGCGRRRCRRRR